MRGRITIGLYNTYDRQRFREAHRRALARAAPLALAFDFNLATFGFPFPEDRRTPVEVADFVANSTSIGEGGRYFIELAEKGRFSYFPYPKSGFPPQFGIPVITTSKLFLERVSPEEIGERSSNGESFLIVFGLGPHGMSKKEKELGRYHLDITEKGMSMETCTVIGAISGIIWDEIKRRT